MQGDMSAEQRKSGPGEPSAELELTDYQHRAEKLAFENKMLRAVLDSMPDNISIKDLQGRYIFDNSSHCRFLGATNTADVVGKTVFDFLPARIAAKVMNRMTKCHLRDFYYILTTFTLKD
jgi:PAS domain S-box-containing protein